MFHLVWCPYCSMCFLFVPVSYLNRPHLQVNLYQKGVVCQYLSLLACVQEELCPLVCLQHHILLFTDAQIERLTDKRERTNLLQNTESCWTDLNAANSMCRFIVKKIAVLGLYVHNTRWLSFSCSDLDDKPKALRSVTQTCSCMPTMPPSWLSLHELTLYVTAASFYF